MGTNKKLTIFQKIFSLPSLIILVISLGLFVGSHYLTSHVHFLILFYLGLILVSSSVGLLPAFFVVILGHAFDYFINPSSLYFLPVNALLACLIYIASRRGLLKNWLSALLFGLAIGLIAGFSDYLLFTLLQGGGATALVINSSFSQVGNMFLVVGETILDILLGIGLALLIYRFLPKNVLTKLELGERYIEHGKFFSLKPDLHVDKNDRVKRLPVSLKLMIVNIFTMVSVGAAVYAVTSSLYKEQSYSAFGTLTKAYATSGSQIISPDKIDSYLADNGNEAATYQSTFDEFINFYNISSDNVAYAYVYQMVDIDGKPYCRTIFDADQALEEDPVQYGDLIPFDDYFMELREQLFNENDKEILGPIVGFDDYGWLMTVYQPLLNEQGKKVAYLGIDVNMTDVINDIQLFNTKTAVLLVGILVLLTGISYVTIDFLVIRKIVTLEKQTHEFDQSKPSEWVDSKEYQERAVIKGGDEIENLYDAICHSEESICDDFKKIEEQTRALLKLEKNIIFVMANMVEERDKCTGDHIIKTQFYTGLLVQQLYKEGLYPDIVDQEYVNNLITAAPLHDVGKIKISDVILNKPGKLTDEEFLIMRSHVVEGGKLIAETLKDVSGNTYLNIAKDVATYHHERWDGKGYVAGLKGEEIPLSARIMAIADVFDALVSKRSYKEPFTYEQAINILKEESGTHFDPKLIEVFLGEDIQKKVKEKLGLNK